MHRLLGNLTVDDHGELKATRVMIFIPFPMEFWSRALLSQCKGYFWFGGEVASVAEKTRRHSRSWRIRGLPAFRAFQKVFATARLCQTPIATCQCFFRSFVSTAQHFASVLNATPNKTLVRNADLLQFFAKDNVLRLPLVRRGILAVYANLAHLFTEAMNVLVPCFQQSTLSQHVSASPSAAWHMISEFSIESKCIVSFEKSS